MLNFDFATLTLVQSTPESSKGAQERPKKMINQFMKTIVPNHRYVNWQAAPTKITKLTKNRKKE